MFDSIIFLTDRYPYGNGESFIHNEIPYLLDAYKKIYIIPVNERNHTVSRLSENDRIVIWKGNRRSSVLSKVLKAPFQLLDKNVDRDLLQLKKYNNLNMENLELVLYFSVEYQKVAKNVIRWLDGKIKGNENILIYSYWLYNTAYVGCLLREKYRSAYLISRGHRFDIYLERNKNNYLPLREYILSNMDHVFPISDDGTLYLKKTYSFQRNIKTQRLGTVDYGLGPFTKKNMTYTIVSCSNIIPVKRCNKIVDILSCLDGFQIQWFHFGDGEEREKLIQYTQNKLSDNVSFHIDGAIPNSELMDFYKNTQVDLFINVSDSEGIPVSMMEALSFGIPVIATNVGGTSEIITDGVNGFLIEKDFEKDFVSKKIMEVFQDRSGLFRANARSGWMKHYSADANYREFFKMVEGYARERTKY